MLYNALSYTHNFAPNLVYLFYLLTSYMNFIKIIIKIKIKPFIYKLHNLLTLKFLCNTRASRVSLSSYFMHIG